jgi:predicted nucleic acid-binding protein
MIAFDTNVLTEVWIGNTPFVQHAASIPVELQTVPVIVIEEIMRGRLNVIRQAEAGKAKVSLDQAYEFFRVTFSKTRQLQLMLRSRDQQAAFDKVFSTGGALDISRWWSVSETTGKTMNPSALRQERRTSHATKRQGSSSVPAGTQMWAHAIPVVTAAACTTG